MSDFNDLRQIREDKEKAEALARQKELEDERRKTEAARRLQDQKTASADKLHGMVVEILQELRDAVYPFFSVERFPSGSWGIVVPDDWPGYELWEPVVVIELEFDELGEAKRFVSQANPMQRRPSKRIPSNLTRQDLVRALKRLHPPESIR